MQPTGLRNVATRNGNHCAMDATNVVSKAEYSRLKGINKSTITRWAKAGRLVVDAEGNVLIAESEALLAESGDASKVGVVERHAQERGRKVEDLTKLQSAKGSGTRPAGSEAYGKRVTESARREAALADMAEMERDLKVGKYLDREGVERALIDNATAIRQTFERIPYDLRLRLAAESDPEKVRQMLSDEIERACRKVASTMRTLVDTLGQPKQ